MAYTNQLTLLNAAVTTTTGEIFAVGDREHLSVQFIASAITSGNGVFLLEVSNDGTNFVQYNRLVDNVVNAITEGDVRVASCTLNSNINKMYFIDHSDHFEYVRAKVTRTTDGTYSAIMHTEIA